MRALAIALILSFAVGARAQGVPPPTVPQMPDEPLPEWHPPPKRDRHALFLQVSPEVMQAQKLRQIGLWVSSFGWAQVFLGGVFYVWAANLNQDLGSPPPPNPPGVFNPAIEDQRNHVEAAAISLLSIGGTLAAGGFILYTVGQWRITSHHKTHPNEPLPPLSGF
ncbi:MAG TPA: hypothetical protein VF997_11675 [Polyangia bacterium]